MSSEIIFSDEFEAARTLSDKRCTLHFGKWKRKVTVRLSSALPMETIDLSSKLIKAIPIYDLPFEIKIVDQSIYIGPVIALMVTNRQKITQKILDKYHHYLQNYMGIKGLVYICSTRGINTKKKTIEGYYYTPNVKDSKQCWKKGIFPYPNSLYRRTRIPHSLFQDLLSIIGGKIFNTPFLNKLQMWELLSTDSQLKKYLPETFQLKADKSLKLLLNKYPSLYLKPINGSFGRGIYKLEKTENGNGYRLINKFGEELLTDSMTKQKGNIVQRDVSFQHKGRNVDFRVIMQKNRKKQWKCNAFIARYGGYKRIYTNDTASLQLGKATLIKAYKYSEEKAKAIELEIIKVCKNACKVLDSSGRHYGDLGIDIIINKNHNIWIIEINNFAQIHEIASLVNNAPELYKEVVTAPLEYAKSLAGF